uniref:Uncharacterized protein n=1 Tax=Knipowitschia caucasica TaxID=637954 RepID=A0AAV2J500_KNICA
MEIHLLYRCNIDHAYYQHRLCKKSQKLPVLCGLDFLVLTRPLVIKEMAPAINRRRIAAALLLSRRRQRRITRSWWVHPLNQRRASHGAFYHLVAELQLFPDRYHSYFRMSVAKMEELLSIVSYVTTSNDGVTHRSK